MGDGSEAFATTAPLAPVTSERKVRSDLEEKLPKPCKYMLIQNVCLDGKRSISSHYIS